MSIKTGEIDSGDSLVEALIAAEARRADADLLKLEEYISDQEMDAPPRYLFALFWERIGAISLFIRMQVAYQVATDKRFARQEFGAYSATARLRIVATALTAESMEVS